MITTNNILAIMFQRRISEKLILNKKTAIKDTRGIL